MKKNLLLTAFMMLGISGIVSAQVSVTATAGTTGPTAYTTVNAAFTAINAGTHQGDVIVTVTGNTTEPATPVPLLKSGASSSSYSSVKIVPQGNVTINSAATPTANRGIIELAGADNVTIDGDDPSTAGPRNLTIQAATSTSAGIACVRLSSNSTTGADGADNNTVKNCILIGARNSSTSTTTSYGVQFSNGVGSSSSSGAYSSLNTLIENNAISRCLHGIWANGASDTYLNSGTIIRNNVLGTSDAATNIGARGIYVQYSAASAGTGSAVIEGNDIRVGEVIATATGYAQSIYGICLEAYNAGCIVRNNNIHDVYQPSTSGYLAAGIGIISGTNNASIEIYNNFIRDIVASRYSTALPSSFVNYGIWVSSAATNLIIRHNTIALLVPNATGTVVNYTSGCIAISSTTATVAEITNNIMVNKNSSTQAFGLFIPGTGAVIANATIDNNAYFAGSVGYYGAVRSSIEAWQAAIGKDAASFVKEPSFVTATDLHITPGFTSRLESGGLTTSVTTDIDGNTRPGPAGSTFGGGTAPDIGADEFDGKPAPATDITPLGIVAPGAIGCEGAATPVTVRLKNEGTSPINFATQNVAVNITVTGAVTTTVSGTITSGILDPLGTGTFAVNTLNTSTPGVYNFKVVTTTVGDTNFANDTAYSTSTVVTPVALPQVVNFTGFTGTDLTTVFPNWREGTGFGVPTGTTSSWLQQTGWTPANTTAKVNLYGNGRREWIVGPKFVATANTRLKFDVAMTDFGSTTVADPVGMAGTDDSVVVKISTDCGASYQDLYVFNAANASTVGVSLTPQIIDLAAYAGQRCIIAFYASDGTLDDAPDYDFHIDNINIENAQQTDLGAIALASPLNNGQCFGASEPVVVTIQNLGVANIDFTIMPATVTVNVTGAITTTLTAVINTGSLAAGATMDVPFTTNLNMSGVGNYNFKVYTTVNGDVITVNDTITASRAGYIALPQSVDFTGYGGSNLTTLFPNWYEAKGQSVPTGTTSDWTSQNVWTGSNVTAKINLFFNTKNDWIVGPKFKAGPASRLKFGVALTDYNSTAADPAAMQGTDDKVIVKISTDCGTTFTDLYTFDASNTAGISNSLVTQYIDLSAYNGQQCIIAFFATDGPLDDAPDYDFHIDNVVIEDAPSVDLGAVDVISPAVGCYTANEQVRVRIRNYGGTAINFATLPVTVTTTLSGVTTSTLTATLSTGTLAPYDTTSIVMSTPLNMSVGGTYTFRAYTTIAGDAVAANDTTGFISRIAIPTVQLPQTVDFTGFTGTNLTTVFPNWSEGSGALRPTGTTSAWLNQSGWTNPANTSAKINLYTTSRKEWLIGPKFNATANSRLRFDVAMTEYNSTTAADPLGMGATTDDSVIVKISTDCGATYQDLLVFNAANASSLGVTFTPQLIDLAAYAGQQCIIAFYASDGPFDDLADYDFHIDNIMIEEAVATNAGAVSVVSPASLIVGQCYTAAENVTVSVKNFGVSTLNFATNPLTVTTNVTGAATATLTKVVNTGSLAPDETMDVVMSNTLDMTASGIYNIRAYTTLNGDIIAGNDTTPVRVVAPKATLPYSFDFTGYTGANLAELSPYWQEAVGETTPDLGNSAWIQQTGWTPANTSAKINLYTNTRKEWLLGPTVAATAASVLKFDVAITNYNATTADSDGMQGTDDKVIVKVSTDCGASFTDLYTFDATNTLSISNTLVPQTISLAAYAGQNCLIAFYATDGTVDNTPDYDFHIDNVMIDNSGTTPVTFTAFTGERRGNANQLSWSTATESNNKGFELQRSVDGTTYTSISFVNSKAENGNSNQALNYAYTDEKIAATASYYYRLKQVDKDGKYNFSNAVFIKGAKATKLELVSVYPNPAKDQLNVSIASPKADNVTLIVTDMTGKVVLQQRKSVANGDNLLQLNMQTLSQGSYLLKAICADGCETAVSKFMKN